MRRLVLSDWTGENRDVGDTGEFVSKALFSHMRFARLVDDLDAVGDQTCFNMRAVAKYRKVIHSRPTLLLQHTASRRRICVKSVLSCGSLGVCLQHLRGRTASCVAKTITGMRSSRPPLVSAVAMGFCNCLSNVLLLHTCVDMLRNPRNNILPTPTRTYTIPPTLHRSVCTRLLLPYKTRSMSLAVRKLSPRAQPKLIAGLVTKSLMSCRSALRPAADTSVHSVAGFSALVSVSGHLRQLSGASFGRNVNRLPLSIWYSILRDAQSAMSPL